MNKKRARLLTIGFLLGFFGGILVGASPDPNGIVAWFGVAVALVGFVCVLFHRELAPTRYEWNQAAFTQETLRWFNQPPR